VPTGEEGTRAPHGVLVELGQVLQGPGPHLLGVGHRLGKPEDRELGTGGSRVAEGVVERVEGRDLHRRRAERPQEPLLLVVGHVGRGADRGRHQGGVLGLEHWRRDRGEHPKQPAPRREECLTGPWPPGRGPLFDWPTSVAHAAFHSSPRPGSQPCPDDRALLDKPPGEGERPRSSWPTPAHPILASRSTWPARPPTPTTLGSTCSWRPSNREARLRTTTSCSSSSSTRRRSCG